MGIENLMMTVNRIPKIELDTGTDWTAVWTAVGTSFATIAVVLVTTIYTAYSFRKTIRAQKELADAQEASRIAHSKAEAVARSRQEWINSLRDVVASFISTGDDLATASVKLIDNTDQTPRLAQIMQRADLQNPFYVEYSRILLAAKLQRAKVQLFTNPREKETGELIKAMDAYIQASMVADSTAHLGEEVIRNTQVIIKNEWVRVKEMK
ncbi:hypothetical protein [Pseudomonas asiatica]|uniref:hypothetical protein n=1 Tax=Pseudomonas asiatica TaxID=2219225 RepID=UPI0032ED4FD3